MSLLSKIRKIPPLIRDEGWLGALVTMVRWFWGRLTGVPVLIGASAEPMPAPPPPPPPPPPLPPPKIDIFRLYDFIAPPVADTPQAFRVDSGTINWVIPSFEIGSGGHLNIFRMIWGLEKLGFRSRIHIVGECRYPDGEAARAVIIKHFVPLAASVEIGEETLLPAEFTMATSWTTAYTVRRFGRTLHKLYFIQDMEPWFTARGSEYVFAEATYNFGFTGITAGDWLAGLMKEKYGMRAYPFGFSCEHEMYHARPRQPGPRKVFFYARHVTPRRGFELGMLALKRVHELLPDVEFLLAGWDMSAYEIPFPHVDAGVAALDDLPGLYAQCDVALVISLTNLSLLPLEIMACGCPVVSNHGPNVEWLLKDRENAILAAPLPEALAEALIEMLENRSLNEQITRNGLDFVSRTSWDTEALRVSGYLEAIREENV
ncbi:MAG: glycosyltransferase family 4 protein [Sulfuricella denitrificans]|nr:glycosyltransferase family 4 protein [Sulfuricella denitrificans]